MINRSVEGNDSPMAKADFERIDRILDVAETAMLAVASEHHLRETKIERWRWDQPEILMSWSPLRQFPSAGKNIRVLVKLERTAAFTCELKSNAWYDARWSADSFTRYWVHFPVGTLSVSKPDETLWSDSPWMRNYVETASEQVSDSARILLTQAMYFFSDGEARRVDETVILDKDRIEQETSAAS